MTTPGVRRSAAVLLAAGSGSRFAASQRTAHPTHKLLSVLPSTASTASATTVGGRSLANMLAANFEANAVVWGAVDVAALVAEATDAAASQLAQLHNPDWADGIATSLAVAVRWAGRHGHDVLVVGLADQPGITPRAWRAVADAVSSPQAPPVAVATYDEVPANPVALRRDVWGLLPTTGDEGARRLIRSEAVEWMPVACEGHPDDVDTLEDLRRWN